MEGFHPGNVLGIILGGVAISAILGGIGLIFWFVKMKPTILKLVEDVKGKMDKTEARREIEKLSIECEKKQDLKVCLPLRDGCSQVILQHFKTVEAAIESTAHIAQEGIEALKKGQDQIWDKLDEWMRMNGKGK